jgi:anti-sigma B factor antagonist
LFSATAARVHLSFEFSGRDPQRVRVIKKSHEFDLVFTFSSLPPFYVPAMPNDTLVVQSLPGRRDGESMLSCAGPFTIQTLFSFQSAVREIGPTHLLILDLTKVPYMDSAGLGALIGAFVSGRKSNRRMVLVGAGERITALIRMSNLEQFFPTYATRGEAESALAGADPSVA